MKQTLLILLLFFGALSEIILGSFIFAGIFLVLIVLIFYESHIIIKNGFRCLRCGLCCKLKVVPSKEDIERIKNAGYKNFLINGKYIKKINGNCMFIKFKKGKAICRINNIKPGLCKRFPIKHSFFWKQMDVRCKRMYLMVVKCYIKAKSFFKKTIK